MFSNINMSAACSVSNSKSEETKSTEIKQPYECKSVFLKLKIILFSFFKFFLFIALIK